MLWITKSTSLDKSKQKLEVVEMRKRQTRVRLCGLIDYCTVSDFITITKVCHYNESYTKGRLKLGIYPSTGPYDYMKNELKRGSRDNQIPPFSNFGNTPFDKIQWMWVTHFLFVHLLPVNHKFLAFCEFFSSLFTSYSLCHLKAGALLWKLLLQHVWKFREISRETKLWVIWGKSNL